MSSGTPPFWKMDLKCSSAAATLSSPWPAQTAVRCGGPSGPAASAALDRPQPGRRRQRTRSRALRRRPAARRIGAVEPRPRIQLGEHGGVQRVGRHGKQDVAPWVHHRLEEEVYALAEACCDEHVFLGDMLEIGNRFTQLRVAF